MANPNLQWEKSAAWNFGLDFGLFKNRISGTIEYYNIATQDMIMNQTLAAFSGFGSIVTNLGEVSNKGIEISLTSTNIKNSIVEWNTTINFSYNKNRIEHLYYTYEDIFDDLGNYLGRRELDDTGNNWFIGQPISAIWNFKQTGIWQANEIDEALTEYNQRPGDPKIWKNPDNALQKNASGIYQYNNDDKVILGQTTAPINWSMRNEVTLFKNLTFSFNIYSRMGHKSTSTAYMNDDNASNILAQGANDYKHEYWTPENPSSEWPRINATVNTASGAPKLFNRNFVRLENISLAYSLPKAWISKLDLQKVRVSGTVRNAAVWCADWPYGDPETGNPGLATRVFMFGINVTF